MFGHGVCDGVGENARQKVWWRHAYACVKHVTQMLSLYALLTCGVVEHMFVCVCTAEVWLVMHIHALVMHPHVLGRHMFMSVCTADLWCRHAYTCVRHMFVSVCTVEVCTSVALMAESCVL